MILHHAHEDFPQITGPFICPACGIAHFMAECIHVVYQGFDEQEQPKEHDFVICVPCLLERVIPVGVVQ